MGGNIKDKWSVPSTSVAHEFIDEYMASANGEYVKVYLYALRHQDEEITIEAIADALNHTESDVRRALTYWEKMGVLGLLKEEPAQSVTVPKKQGKVAPAPAREQKQAAPAYPETSVYSGKTETSVYSEKTEIPMYAGKTETPVYSEKPEVPVYSEDPELVPVYSPEQVNRLSQDEEFSQLLYIAQKYMNKVFTPRDCQVFAYLYENLGMNEELLEYLVEYCVQNNHTSVRYIEAVARNWHEKGIRTAQEAKDFSAAYNRDSFAVMKAFGINSRKPAAPELKLMNRWFKEYGFTREMVLEACNRTITAIHNPSFEYADKILAEWKKSGIRTLTDLKEQDAKRSAAREENTQSREKRLQKYDTAVSSQGNRARRAPNQFHNFEQRDTDYDALMLKQVKEWVQP